MSKDDKKLLAASAEERVRLSEARIGTRRGAQAEFARVVARLEVEDDVRRAEAALAEAELNLARYGDVAEPIKQGFFQRLLGIGIVLQGRREFEGLVAARRAQLERLRTVDGPERIARADELARVLREGAEHRVEVEPSVQPQPAVPEVLLDEAATGPHAVDAPLSAPSKPNGRSSRSPYG